MQFCARIYKPRYRKKLVNVNEFATGCLTELSKVKIEMIREKTKVPNRRVSNRPMTTPEQFRAYREESRRAEKTAASLERQGLAECSTTGHNGSIVIDVARMPKQQVCVYFIRCEKFIKIGFSADWKTRLVGIRVDNPFPLEPLAIFEGGPSDESRLHKLFAEQRHVGEWFHDCKPIRDFIAENRGKCLLERPN